MAIDNDFKNEVDRLLKEGKTVSQIANEKNVTRAEVLDAISEISIPDTEDKHAKKTAKDEKTEDKKETAPKSSSNDEDTTTSDTPAPDVNNEIVNESTEAMKNAAKILGEAANKAGNKIVEVGDKAYNATKNVLTDKEKQRELKAKAGDALKKAGVQFDKATSSAADAINDAFNSAKKNSETGKVEDEAKRVEKEPSTNVNDGFDFDEFGRQAGDFAGKVVNGLGSVFGGIKKSFLDGYNGSDEDKKN